MPQSVSVLALGGIMAIGLGSAVRRKALRSGTLLQ
jgi:hypothetical protein